MDMHDPSLSTGGELKEQETLRATSAEVEAGKTAEAAVAPAIDATPAMEVEDMMAAAEEADASREAARIAYGEDVDDEEAAQAQEAAINDESEADEAADGQHAELTHESLVAAATALLARDAADISADEIRRLRQQHTMLHKHEQADAISEEKAEDAHQAAAETTAEAAPDEFTLIMDRIRAKKAEWAAEQEKVRQANLERKNEIIDEINALAEDTDNVNRTFARYRELQDEFNAIGDVDPMQETGVWKRFQDAREHYSDNLKINKELRDYDFKKNLTDKEALLAEAEALAANEDVIAAYRRLQELHNKWRQIGPVAKELRDDIWNRFRDASAEVNKRYQAFFEARKARENENEIAKTALCTQIESLDTTGLRTFAAWEDMTRRVIELQGEWRKLGFASKKMNRQLFTRFRTACDAFFAAKAEFYRATREELATNLAHKQQLVETAESLKDSTDWRATADRFVELQKEWKTIGAIPKKYSEELWNRFTAACDHFFEQKKKAGSGARSAESANLRIKREIIGLLSAIVSEIPDKETALTKLRELQQRWQETGHVPFREKDKLYEAYRSAVDAVRNHFALADQRARRRRFEENVERLDGDAGRLGRERERLARALEARRNDLRTYENNLGFLSAKSKSGDSLMRDMERRIERLKADIADIQEKIRLVDAKL
ncbi:MAG: DUF349 domain-containing protein [Muribaculaceae bacterium]|nr:DUF349 domain-containing protein [Muribaculaceae bacterium]